MWFFFLSLHPWQDAGWWPLPQMTNWVYVRAVWPSHIFSHLMVCLHMASLTKCHQNKNSGMIGFNFNNWIVPLCSAQSIFFLNHHLVLAAFLHFFTWSPLRDTEMFRMNPLFCLPLVEYGEKLVWKPMLCLLNLCRGSHKGMIKCFHECVFFLYLHMAVCCFSFHTRVGVEQIHVIPVIDLLLPAESLMERRFKSHPLFSPFCLL